MKLILDHINVREADRLDSWIEESLSALLPLVRIEEARVRVEYRPENSPAFKASALVVIPGPDLRVEASDHTARTAFLKVMALLRQGAAHRAERRLRRTSGERRLPGFMQLAGSRR